MNGVFKAAKIATAKQAQRDENEKPKSSESKPERKATPAGLGIGNSNGNGNGNKQSAAKSSGQQPPITAGGQKGEWQPAPGRKSHKKNKSTAGGQPRSPRTHGGEPMPANESERKGG